MPKEKKRNPMSLQARAIQLFNAWAREDSSLSQQLLEVHGRAYAAFDGYRQMIRLFQMDLAEAYCLPNEADVQHEVRDLSTAIYDEQMRQEQFIDECVEGMDSLLERMAQARIDQCKRMWKQLDDMLAAHEEGRW